MKRRRLLSIDDDVVEFNDLKKRRNLTINSKDFAGIKYKKKTNKTIIDEPYSVM